MFQALETDPMVITCCLASVLPLPIPHQAKLQCLASHAALTVQALRSADLYTDQRCVCVPVCVSAYSRLVEST